MPSANILTCTWGAADVTFLARQRFQKDLNARVNFSSFIASNDFFGGDPNVGILKSFVLVYQQTPQSADGAYHLGPIYTKAGVEGDNVQVNWVNPPAAGPSFVETDSSMPTQRYIFSAYWHNMDVTGPIQAAFHKVQSAQSEAVPVTVNAQMYSVDPAPGLKKSLSVTYGSWYSGRWVYQAVTDVQKPTSCTLSIPGLPPYRTVGCNIVVATYGGIDVTAKVQKMYEQFAKGEMTLWYPGKLKWTFTPSNDLFGGDPNYGIQKVFVMIFRIANLLVDHSGDPNDFAYPLSLDTPISGYRFLSSKEKEPCTWDPNAYDWSPDPYSIPPPALLARGDWANPWPWIYKAVYSQVDVTSALQAEMARVSNLFTLGGQIVPPSPAPTWAPNLPTLAKGDPWPGMQKQLTLVIQWPSSLSIDDTPKWEPGFLEYGLVNLQPQETFVIPTSRSLAYSDHVVQATSQIANFSNAAPVTAWPKITGVDTPSSFSWDPRPSSDWVMYSNQSKRVDLINNAGCQPGYTYNITFNIMSVTDPNPTSVRVSSNAAQTVTFALTAQQTAQLIGGSGQNYGSFFRAGGRSLGSGS